MPKPKLLDLFCGAGGCAKGYQNAGFYVVGVDINPQPRYIGDRFIQADAIKYVSQHAHKFDIIHASPPCQFYSVLRSVCGNKKYPDLIETTRQLLKKTGKPYVIENVEGARSHLLNPVLLCGTQFGLKVYRHRLFECFPFLLSPPHSSHFDQSPGAGKGLSPKGFVTVCGHRAGTNGGGWGEMSMPERWQYVTGSMGIDWMNHAELSQAIPPAYTEWIGRQIMSVLINKLEVC